MWMALKGTRDFLSKKKPSYLSANRRPYIFIICTGSGGVRLLPPPAYLFILVQGHTRVSLFFPARKRKSYRGNRKYGKSPPTSVCVPLFWAPEMHFNLFCGGRGSGVEKWKVHGRILFNKIRESRRITLQAFFEGASLCIMDCSKSKEKRNVWGPMLFVASFPWRYTYARVCRKATGT